MRILRIQCRSFRGFDDFGLLPEGHVLLVGEPGAGRSDLLDGLNRVLSPDWIRQRQPIEADFHKADTSRRAEVELTIGDLGEHLEQTFFDALEVWDRASSSIVDVMADPEAVDKGKHDLVVRLAYRARWDKRAEQGEHWVDYAKLSDPDADQFSRASRAERAELSFASVDPRSRAFDIGSRGGFRRLVERGGTDSFSLALGALEDQIAHASEGLSSAEDVAKATSEILSTVASALGLDPAQAAKAVRFVPEGGSISGLLRSLQVALTTPDSSIPLELARHGSTVQSVLQVAQGLALAGKGGVVAIDDFGESMGGSMALHLATVIRGSTSQCWLSTRQPQAAGAFEPQQIVRLARDASRVRRAYKVSKPVTKADRRVARHLLTQFLPASSARGLIVVEGQHDFDSYSALSHRLLRTEGLALPASRHASLVNTGAVNATEGGLGSVAGLCAYARSLGFRTVALIDHDGEGVQQAAELGKLLANADCVVRLPRDHAVERALVSGVGDDALRAAVKSLHADFGMQLPPNVETLNGLELERAAAAGLKEKGGLHVQYLEAIPDSVAPSVARSALVSAVDAAGDASRSGLVQL